MSQFTHPSCRNLPRNILVTGSYGKVNCAELICRILTAAGYRADVFADPEAFESRAAEEGGDEGIRIVTAAFSELKRINRSPDLVVVTSVSSYPLRNYRRYRDLLADIEDFQEKLEAGTTIVLNHDYLFLRSVLPKRCTEFNVRLYSLNTEITGDGVCLTGDRVVTLKAGGVERPLLPAEDLLLQGERNLGIYLAAVSAVGPAAGTDVIARELRAFRGDRKHFSCYPLERGVRLYVQLNTGLPSMAEAAFVGFERRLVIVTGNFAEQPDDVSYQGLALMISAYARKLVLFGPDRDILEYAVRKVGVGKSWELPIVKKETADAAVRYAVNSAYPGEWVMFSPVDASDSRYFDPERMAFVVET